MRLIYNEYCMCACVGGGGGGGGEGVVWALKNLHH